MTSMRSLLPVLVAGALLLACTGGDGDDAGPATDDAADEDAAPAPAARFCDVFLDYLAEPSPDNLEAVTATADDPQVEELAAIIGDDDRTGRVLAADSDLQAIARERCQAEWIGAAQGGGDTAGAAQALLDALAAGDRLGAANVASANAIAAFEPWEPIEPDPVSGTPRLLTVGERTFTMALDDRRIAECQVEAGVVISCTVAE